MNQLLRDPVFLLWLLMTVGFLFIGGWAFLMWVQVRGIRGLALTVLAFSLALLTALLSLVRAGEGARVPMDIVTMGIRIVFPTMLLSMGVLVDLWAADHNDHRSLTTITYQWWKHMTHERFLKTDRRESVQEIGK